MMAINPSESAHFHVPNGNAMMDTTSNQFIEDFFTPEAQNTGGYQDFLQSNGLNANGDFRNTTDDLTLKFLEGTSNGFPASQGKGPASSYPMYGNGGGGARNISRSFSLIMQAFEQDSLGLPAPQQPQMMDPQFAVKKYPEQPQSPQSIQDLYNRYNVGTSSNHSSTRDTFMPLDEPQPQQQQLQKVPQKCVDELMCTLRDKSQQHQAPQLKKQRSSSDMSTESSRGYRRSSPFEDTVNFPTGGLNNANASGGADKYERNVSIGTKLFRALQRTKTENVESAATRRAARQQLRVMKTKKHTGLAKQRVSAAAKCCESYVEFEVLVQRTKSIMEENKSLKAKLEMLMSRMNPAQQDTAKLQTLQTSPQK